MSEENETPHNLLALTQIDLHCFGNCVLGFTEFNS